MSRMVDRRFRVLFIDDSRKVIENLQGRVPDPKTVDFENERWTIDVVTVHVTLEVDSSGDWVIDGDTIRLLAQALSNPVDLICVDYGYIDERVMNDLKEQAVLAKEAADKGHPPIIITRRGKYQTFSSLIEQIRDLCVKGNGGISPFDLQILRSNFLQFSGRIWIYTFIRDEWQKEIGRIKERVVAVQNQIPTAFINAIDTREEMFDCEKYEKQHQAEFYAYLVTGWLNHVVQRELQSLLLRRASRLKFIRTKNSLKAAAVALSLGGAVGASGDWLGSTVLGLLRGGQLALGFVVLGLSVTVVIVVGLTMPTLVERVLVNLFGREDD